MQLAVKIRQREIRRLQRTELLALIGTQPKIPGSKRGIMRYGLVDEFGKRRHVEPGFARIFVNECLSLRFGEREAQLVAADALRLYFKPRRALQIGSCDP